VEGCYSGEERKGFFHRVSSVDGRMSSCSSEGESEEERRSLLQLAQTWHEAVNLEASAELVKQSVTVSAPQTQQAGP
jgi:hypothetical protein